jgi:hypothetical protein
MDIVTLREALPTLRTPVLLAAFEGWNDAGECATLAVDTFRRATSARPFADLDPEAFYDFQQTRPTVRTDADGRRVIDWPRLEIAAAQVEGGRGDLVIVRGDEPNLRWRTFADAIVDLSRALDVRLLATIGALQVDVPHTRPVPVTISSDDPGLRAELALRPSSYEGPTGMTGVLHATAAAAGLPSLSMWAGVPHYLAATPYLRGGLVLAERLAAILGTEIPLHSLARDAATQNDEIAELIAHDDELEEYVGELEERAAATDDGALTEEPTLFDVDVEVDGDELAAELERYLRGER